MNDNQLQIELLQLQRATLVDIQTVLQILIDKGICNTNDIIETRSKIENTSQDIKRIDNEITKLGGSIKKVSESSSFETMPLNDKMKVLAELIQQFNSQTK